MRNIDKIKSLEKELGKYRKKVTDQDKIIRKLSGELERAHAGAIQLQAATDAVLTAAALAHGEGRAGRGERKKHWLAAARPRCSASRRCGGGMRYTPAGTRRRPPTSWAWWRERSRKRREREEEHHQPPDPVPHLRDLWAFHRDHSGTRLGPPGGAGREETGHHLLLLRGAALPPVISISDFSTERHRIAGERGRRPGTTGNGTAGIMQHTRRRYGQRKD